MHEENINFITEVIILFLNMEWNNRKMDISLQLGFYILFLNTIGEWNTALCLHLGIYIWIDFQIIAYICLRHEFEFLDELRKEFLKISNYRNSKIQLIINLLVNGLCARAETNINNGAQYNLSKESHKNLMCLEENEVQMFYITFRKPEHFNMTYNFLL